MKQQKSLLQTKEQGKNLQDKWRRNRQPTWKRIQSNDSQNDLKSQKQNGEDTRNIYKDLEELKSKQSVMNNYWN